MQADISYVVWEMFCNRPLSLHQCSGSFWAYIVGQDPNDSKSSQLHVDFFQFFFYSFEVYTSIDSSNMIGNPPEVSNFNRLFSQTQPVHL